MHLSSKKYEEEKKKLDGVTVANRKERHGEAPYDSVQYEALTKYNAKQFVMSAGGYRGNEMPDTAT